MFQIDFPEWDKDLLVYLNGIHYPWLDSVMTFMSSYFSWILVCLCIVIYMIYKGGRRGWLAPLFMLLGIGINSLANNAIKLIVMRPRPGQEISLHDIVRQLGDVDAGFSYFSAHSSNSVCLALFVTLYFRNRYLGIAMFAWAIIVAYSRIYTGKHYPLDVISGILFGIFTGWFSYWAYCKYCEKQKYLKI